METAEILSVMSLCFSAVTLILCCVMMAQLRQQKDSAQTMDEIRKEIKEELKDSREENAAS